MSKRFIQVKMDDGCRDGNPVTLSHAPPTGSGYATLCGLDGDDAVVGQYPVAEKAAKITCQDCLEIWKVCKGLRKSDFAVAA